MVIQAQLPRLNVSFELQGKKHVCQAEHVIAVDGSEILYQLRLVVYPIIYRVLHIQTVVVWDLFHQQYLHFT